MAVPTSVYKLAADGEISRKELAEIEELDRLLQMHPSELAKEAGHPLLAIPASAAAGGVGGGALGALGGAVRAGARKETRNKKDILRGAGQGARKGALTGAAVGGLSSAGLQGTAARRHYLRGTVPHIMAPVGEMIIGTGAGTAAGGLRGLASSKKGESTKKEAAVGVTVPIRTNSTKSRLELEYDRERAKRGKDTYRRVGAAVGGTYGAIAGGALGAASGKGSAKRMAAGAAAGGLAGLALGKKGGESTRKRKISDIDKELGLRKEVQHRLRTQSQEKEARVFGSVAPGGMSEASRPYKHRKREWKGHLKRKSKEAPTSKTRAGLTGAAVGAGLGGLVGLSGGGGAGSALAGAALGGASGALTGLGMRATDKAHIAHSKRSLSQKGGVDSSMSKAIKRERRQQAAAEEARRMERDARRERHADRRHQDMMGALQQKRASGGRPASKLHQLALHLHGHEAALGGAALGGITGAAGGAAGGEKGKKKTRALQGAAAGAVAGGLAGVGARRGLRNASIDGWGRALGAHHRWGAEIHNPTTPWRSGLDARERKAAMHAANNVVFGFKAAAMPAGARDVAVTAAKGLAGGLGLYGGQMALSGLHHGLAGLADKLSYRKDLGKLLAVHPSISEGHSPEDIDLVYRSIRRFSPEVAKDPLVGGRVLDTVLRNRDRTDPSGPPRFELGIAQELQRMRPAPDRGADLAANAFLTGARSALDARADAASSAKRSEEAWDMLREKHLNAIDLEHMKQNRP